MKYKYNGQWYDIYSSPLLNNLLIGEILQYAGSNIPGGYLLCDGSAVSRIEYSELFDVIGEIYGSGDGSTTFNLPDLQPYLTINYIIRAKKNQSILANVSSVINSLDGNSTTDAPSINAVNERFTYSTNEQVIGTWIDGKPLYRKTVSFTIGSSSDTLTIISGLTNIKEIPYYSGYIYMSDTETFLVPSPNANNCPYFSINRSSHTVREAHTNNACNNKTCVITFNYTKTTD